MNSYKPVFRGWTIPGHIPPGALGHGPAVEPGESLDALCGHFRIFQLEKGHRFSTDDLLAAWYGTAYGPYPERVLDLGSGIGTVAMVAAWRLPGSRFVTVEVQPESVRLARKSVEWNGLSGRIEIRQGDFREPSAFSPDERFSLILGSPPYFPPGSGVEGDHPQKIACRFEMKGSIADYARVASERLAPGGLFACVFPINPPEQHRRVREAAAHAGLAIVRWRSVVLRESEPPLLGLFAMIRSSELPDWFRDRSWEEPPLTIRRTDGSIDPEYSALKLSFGFPP